MEKQVRVIRSRIRKTFKKISKWFHHLPDRKRYFDLVAGVLGIPALILVIILNYNNLQSNKKPTTPAPTPVQTSTTPIIIQTGPSGAHNTGSSDNSIPSSTACKKQIGPISISYPQEGATISDNPLNIIIKYDDTDYCSVVWSYRINGGQWSDYSSNSIALYNMPSGNITLDLRVQSTVSQDQSMITRHFTYNGSNNNPTPSQASSSAH
jgi:hypothetical protein